MPKRILVTGAGGAAAISFMRALDPRQYTILAADIDPHATGLYMVPAADRMLIPRGDHPDFVDALLRACSDKQIDVLVPTVDTELLPLARARHAFRAMGTDVLVARPSALETCLDKWALVRACRGHVPVPASRPLTRRVDLGRVPYPVIAKPRTGSGGRGVRLLRSAADAADLPRDGSILLQEYLPGAEYSVDVFVSPGGIVEAAVPRERLKVDSGVAVCGRTLRDRELEQLSARVASLTKLTHVANIQWRRDKHGRPRLLEVNPRFPGTMPLTIAAGVDMPNLALRAVMGLSVPPVPRHREVALVRRWEEIPVSVRELRSMEAAAAQRRGRDETDRTGNDRSAA